MRFIAALLATLLIGGTVVAVPSPTLATIDGEIDEARIHYVNRDDFVWLDADIEAEGHEQLYLSYPSRVFELNLDISELGDNHNLVDGFTLKLTNGAFSGAYTTTTTNGNADTGACTTTWDTSGLGDGELAGDVLCAGAGVNHGTAIPFAITLPASGPVVLEVDTAGEDFSVYFFVAESGDTIYVGNSTLADGGASCGESGPDFTTDDSGHGSIQAALSAAFMAVDDDEDVIVVCDGEYTYGEDIGQYNGGPFHDSITLEAESVGGVILDGGTIWSGDAFEPGDNPFEVIEPGFQMLRVENADLTVRGVELRNGYAFFEGDDLEDGGGAIFVENGTLTLEEVNLVRNAGYAGGAVLVASGGLNATQVRASQNVALGGGAFTINEGSAEIRDSRFQANVGLIFGGAIFGVSISPMHVARADFSLNATAVAGGAIAIAGGDLTIEGGSFTGNNCYPFEFGPDGDCDGGAIAVIPSPYDDSRTLSVTGAAFRSNSASASGGAIWVATDSQVSLRGNNFVGNSATEQGGAVRLDQGTDQTSIVGNTFSVNEAMQGGALSINDGFGEDLRAYMLRISGNSFSSNAASGSGGALHMAFDNSGNVAPRNVRSNRFVRNSAPNGGAIVVESDYGSERTIQRRFERALRSNRFTANRAQDRQTMNIGVHFD